jgi:hypothetical protein
MAIAVNIPALGVAHRCWFFRRQNTSAVEYLDAARKHRLAQSVECGRLARRLFERNKFVDFALPADAVTDGRHRSFRGSSYASPSYSAGLEFELTGVAQSVELA